jgi:hypothetical protein
MRFDRLLCRRVRLALVLGVVVGFTGQSGCSPEGTNSAPKMKGSKDEIQKALQSGGARPDAKSKVRRKG